MYRSLPLLAVLVACDEASFDPGHDADADLAVPSEGSELRSQQDGTPEGIGLLAFVNDPTTTLTVLDDLVPLDARAAKSIIAHRNGLDGVLGTGTDNLFDSTQEIDDRYYVGQTAMDALASYALNNGWVPEGDDPLGTFDGVAFTADEAALTLAFVNSADLHTLDDLVPLDSRVANSIVTLRPFPSVLHLSDVQFLGPSGMGAIKAWAVSHAAAPAPQCDLQPTAISRADADDADALIAMATTRDWPVASVRAFSVACPGWETDAAKRQAVVEGLWSYTFAISYAAVPPQDRPVGAPVPGGATFDMYVGDAFYDVETYVEDHRWDPNATPEGAALYANRDAIEAALHAETTGASEFRVRLEAEECSENAAVLVRPDGVVIVAHTFPRC